MAAWHEVGSVFERGSSRDYLNSVSLGLVAETLVGPIFAGTSWGEGELHKIYFPGPAVLIPARLARSASPSEPVQPFQGTTGLRPSGRVESFQWTILH